MENLRVGVEGGLGRERARLEDLFRSRRPDALALESGDTSPVEALRTGAVELALVRGPTAVAALCAGGLFVAAVLGRDDPRDVLVTADPARGSLDALPAGARVGVAGARRRAYLRARRPDLQAVSPANGGGPAKALLSRSVDAIVVPTTEARELPLERLGSEVLDAKAWVPSPGQGAHVLLGRAGDAGPSLPPELDEHGARAAFRVEAAVARLLPSGGDAPVGVLAVAFGPWVRCWGMVATPDGRRMVRGDLTGSVDDPEALAEALVTLLDQRGGRQLLESTRP